MCVICYKSKSKKLPSKEHIERMWNRNHDGAGIMWRTPNGVSFRKGFMHLSEFLTFVDANRRELEAAEVAMHFRIGTHGGNTPGNCHPFIVDSAADMHLLSADGVKAPVLMHNGILPLAPRRKSISDTAELALRAGRYVDPMDFLTDADELLTGNRVIVFAPNGVTKFLGDAFKKGADGLMYSNLYSEPIDYSGYFGRKYDFGKWSAFSNRSSLTEEYKQPLFILPDKEKREEPVKQEPPAKSEDAPVAWPPKFPAYLDAQTNFEKNIAARAIECVLEWAGLDAQKMSDQDWDSFFVSWEEDITNLYDDELAEELDASEEVGAMA